MGYYQKIKVSGIYQIYNRITEEYYIGYSLDILGSRWSAHYQDIVLGKHTSFKCENFKIEDWDFRILEKVSKTEFKEELRNRLKEEGIKYSDKLFENEFRKLLLKKEKEWMSKYSVNFAINKNNKSFA